MIDRINNYAITSGQPGIINEEAFTTLELVGKCAQKVNECIDQVNENTDKVSTLELQYAAVREIAQTGVRKADAAQADADAAQAAAEAAQATADAAEAASEVSVINIPVEYSELVEYGAPGENGVLNIQWSSGFLPALFQPAFRKIKRNLLESENEKRNSYEFVLRGTTNSSEDAYLNGSLKIYLTPRNSASHGSRSSFIFELHLTYSLDNTSTQGDAVIYTIFGAGSIENGDYSVSGIPYDAVYLNKSANWIYNVGQL